LSSRVPKAKVALALKLKESPPLSSSTKPDPIKPVTVPPTVYLAPPPMGQPASARAAAIHAALRNLFTLLSGKFYNSYWDNRSVKSCP
jgi:hypothetical protein